MKRALWAALLTAFLISGCATGGVRIAQIKDMPTRYDNRSVSITGTVTNSWGIPLVPFQFYNVDDGSGEITVLSQSGRAPAKGTRVQVKGRVNELAVFGGRSVGLHLREQDRHVRR